VKVFCNSPTTKFSSDFLTYEGFSFEANFNALMFEIFGQKFFNGDVVYDMFVRSFLLSSLYIESEEGAYMYIIHAPPPPRRKGS